MKRRLSLKCLGFSLIELIIVVAILGILATIAYPSYREHVRRAHRLAAQEFLLDVAQRQEQLLIDRRSYGSTLADLNLSLPNKLAANYQFEGCSLNTPGQRPFFQCAMRPLPGGTMRDVNPDDGNNGRLFINSRGERWRETNSACAVSACAFTASMAF